MTKSIRILGKILIVIIGLIILLLIGHFFYSTLLLEKYSYIKDNKTIYTIEYPHTGKPSLIDIVGSDFVTFYDHSQLWPKCWDGFGAATIIYTTIDSDTWDDSGKSKFLNHFDFSYFSGSEDDVKKFDVSHIKVGDNNYLLVKNPKVQNAEPELITIRGNTYIHTYLPVNKNSCASDGSLEVRKKMMNTLKFTEPENTNELNKIESLLSNKDNLINSSDVGFVKIENAQKILGIYKD